MTNLLSRSFLSALFVTSMVACNGDKDPATDDTDTDVGGDTEVSCESGIASTFPDADATGVFYRTPIEVTFNSDENGTSTLTLADAAGTDVPGSVTYSDDGITAFFAPNADLAPETQYTLTVAYSCDKVAEITFTTSTAGTAIADATTLLDRVYNVDIASGRITEPPGVGQLLMPLIEEEGFFILVSPYDYDDTANELSFIGALGEDDGTGNIVQDVCNETIAFPVAATFDDNPYMEISGNNVELSVQGIDLTLQTVDLAGAFSPDGSSIEGLTLGGTADTVPLGPLLDFDTAADPQAVCNLLTTFGVTCADCGDGSVTCITLLVDSMTADEQTGAIDEILEVTAEGCE